MSVAIRKTFEGLTERHREGNCSVFPLTELLEAMRKRGVDTLNPSFSARLSSVVRKLKEKGWAINQDPPDPKGRYPAMITIDLP